FRRRSVVAPGNTRCVYTEIAQMRRQCAAGLVLTEQGHHTRADAEAGEAFAHIARHSAERASAGYRIGGFEPYRLVGMIFPVHHRAADADHLLRPRQHIAATEYVAFAPKRDDMR